MSHTLLNRSGRQELRLEPFHKKRREIHRLCLHCGKWIFTRGSIQVEHAYCIEHLAVPWTDVILHVTVNVCDNSNVDTHYSMMTPEMDL